MNYALDALWQHLHHPRTRTLAALLTAPPPWRSGREIPVSLLLGSHGFRLLEQWDRQPESQPQALQNADEQQALGRYAESLLAEAQVFGRKQKAVLDQVAAQAILQGFFDGGAAEYFNGREEGSEESSV